MPPAGRAHWNPTRGRELPYAQGRVCLGKLFTAATRVANKGGGSENVGRYHEMGRAPTMITPHGGQIPKQARLECAFHLPVGPAVLRLTAAAMAGVSVTLRPPGP